MAATAWCRTRYRETRIGFGSEPTRYGREAPWCKADIHASAWSYRRDTTCASSWRGSGHRASTDQVQACGEVEYDDYGPQTDEPTRGGHRQQVVANGAAVQVTWHHQVYLVSIRATVVRTPVSGTSTTAQATAGH